MAEHAVNGHDKSKGGGKWANIEFRRAYNKRWRAKQKKLKKKAAKGAKVTPRKVKKKHDQYDDAVIYLRKAVSHINKRVNAGGEETWGDLMAKIALKTLQGETE
jgi:hypothetical protein